MSHTSTHTFAKLAISEIAFEEIKGRLKKAGYSDQFVDEQTIDMHGIALVPEDHVKVTTSRRPRPLGRVKINVDEFMKP